MKIVKWLRDGDGLSCDGINTSEGLLECAGNALDNACAYDIMGEVLFLADDGRYYVGTVEFMICEANPTYVKDVLDNPEEE